MIPSKTLNLSWNTVPLEYSHVAPVFPPPPANVATLISGTPEVFMCHQSPTPCKLAFHPWNLGLVSQKPCSFSLNGLRGAL